MNDKLAELLKNSVDRGSEPSPSLSTVTTLPNSSNAIAGLIPVALVTNNTSTETLPEVSMSLPTTSYMSELPVKQTSRRTKSMDDLYANNLGSTAPSTSQISSEPPSAAGPVGGALSMSTGNSSVSKDDNSAPATAWSWTWVIYQ